MSVLPVCADMNPPLALLLHLYLSLPARSAGSCRMLTWRCCRRCHVCECWNLTHAPSCCCQIVPWPTWCLKHLLPCHDCAVLCGMVVFLQPRPHGPMETVRCCVRCATVAMARGWRTWLQPMALLRAQDRSARSWLLHRRALRLATPALVRAQAAAVLAAAACSSGTTQQCALSLTSGTATLRNIC